ncbi:MAG: hypothetical protein NTX65_03595 [Ignavibacteriales bacterium]|nr:hypothetical protein [Ignavibacteriales bacterium]
MKLYEKFIMTVVFGCLLILVESCSTSSLVDVWNDPSYHESPLKKIFVIAIRKDPVQRRIWEDAFVSELSKHGVQATSSYNLFPDLLPDTNQVIQTVQEKGFDGILITRLLYDETKSHYVDSYVTTKIESRYNIFRKRYDTYFRNVQHPGYVESQIINRRAIDVWVIRNDERMIWSATSNSPERNSIKAVQEDIAELVIPALRRKAIIK